jgi:hypothetical protein
MTSRSSNNESKRNPRNSPSRSNLGWVSVLVSLSSQAQGFHSSGRRPLAKMRSPDTLADPSMSRIIAGGDRRQRNGNVFASSLSRLRYRDHDEELQVAATSSTDVGKWWNNFFQPPPSDNDDTQEGVDDYLEFLNRRYNRLYSEESEEDRSMGFSALNWLRAGGEGSATENSLYVLGVAGLASQKLLQKHQIAAPQQQPENVPFSLQETSTRPARNPVHKPTINVLDAVVCTPESAMASKIAQQIAPVVRCIQSLERQRQIFLRAQTRKLTMLLSASFRTLFKALVYGPVKAANAVLEVGGGKKSLTLAFAIAYATLLLLRPVLQAVVTDGSYRA